MTVWVMGEEERRQEGGWAGRLYVLAWASGVGTVYCTYSGVTEYAFGGKYEHCILHLAVTE